MISNNFVHRLADDEPDADVWQPDAQRHLLAHMATLPGESISVAEAQAYTGLCLRATREFLRRLCRSGFLVEGNVLYANNRKRLVYVVARDKPAANAMQQARKQVLAVRKAHPLHAVWAQMSSLL